MCAFLLSHSLIMNRVSANSEVFSVLLFNIFGKVENGLIVSGTICLKAFRRVGVTT